MMIFMLLQINMITLCSLSLVRADRAADTKRNVSFGIIKQNSKFEINNAWNIVIRVITLQHVARYVNIYIIDKMH